MRLATIFGFVLCGIMMLVLAIVSRLNPDAIARFGTLLDHAMTSRAARVTFVVFWWWIGWHFLVNGG